MISVGLAESLRSAVCLEAALVEKLRVTALRDWPPLLAVFVERLIEARFHNRIALITLLSSLAERMDGIVSSRHPAASIRSVRPPGAWIEEPSWSAILKVFERDCVAWLSELAAGSRPASNRVDFARCFIDTHYADSISLPQLAALTGCCRSHLTAAFRQHTGSSVHQYIASLRMNHAAELIRQGEKIEAVILTVGYRSRKNFIRQFRKHYRVNPAQYKRLEPNEIVVKRVFNDAGRRVLSANSPTRCSP